jgi:hypothetical protein
MQLGRLALALAVVGCSPPAANAPADPPAASTASAAATTSPPEAVVVSEAPTFDVFFRGLPLCSRTVMIARSEDGWVKAYRGMAQSLAPEVLAARFRKSADAAGLPVREGPAGILSADDEGAGVGAALSQFVVLVIVRLEARPTPGIELSLRGEPREVGALVEALGGVDAIRELEITDGERIGHDVRVRLVRRPLVTDMVIEEAAASVKLVAKPSGAFASVHEPAPGRTVFAVVPHDDKEGLTIISNRAGTDGGAACDEHVDWRGPDGRARRARPTKEEEEELLRDMLGP